MCACSEQACGGRRRRRSPEAETKGGDDVRQLQSLPVPAASTSRGSRLRRASWTRLQRAGPSVAAGTSDERRRRRSVVGSEREEERGELGEEGGNG